jgi:light-regulated signal transduction histidine kinase (bacteriophytochrome)
MLLARNTHLSLIVRETSRMEALIQGLLGLSRVGRQSVQPRPTDLNLLVREVIDSISPDARDRHIEWHVLPLPAMTCDPVLIKIALTNLLGNALKFTRPRSPAVIEVGIESHDRELVFHVRDNGVGFSMKYADKLFGIFQRLHSAEQFEGTGVGLATVRRIVQKHGGRIWAEAELDKGATFYFTLGNFQSSEKHSKAMATGGSS